MRLHFKHRNPNGSQNHPKLNLAALTGRARVHGFTARFDTDYGEYRVQPKGQPKAAYFTDDFIDAWQTLNTMIEYRTQQTAICAYQELPA